MACDDRVVGMGASAEAYAEGILKVAERSLTPSGVHRLALFSAKRMLERRLEMILNRDRARDFARQWKYLIAPAGLIVLVAWLLVPASTARRGLARPQLDSAAHKLELVKSLGESRAYKDLIELVLRDPDEELRRLAAIRLTELEGDGSTAAMLELYDKSGDPVVKMMVIDTLGRISEIEPLTKIALSAQSPEYRRRALMRINWLKATSESADVNAWDVSALQEQLDQAPFRPLRRRPRRRQARWLSRPTKPRGRFAGTRRGNRSSPCCARPSPRTFATTLHFLNGFSTMTTSARAPTVRRQTRPRSLPK